MQGQIVTEPTVQKMAEKYHKTPAQIVLRWDLQHEVVTIPKSVHANRIAENTQIFDFELSQADMDGWMRWMKESASGRIRTLSLSKREIELF